jgi:hypothetical protein
MVFVVYSGGKTRNAEKYMGISVEFNPDLALRDISEYQKGHRKIEECIPENLEVGQAYAFLKRGQRNYWMHGEIPLIETRGDGELSRPRASIQILEATHFVENGEMWTKGKYTVIEVFSGDQIQFEGLWRVGHLKY